MRKHMVNRPPTQREGGVMEIKDKGDGYFDVVDDDGETLATFYSEDGKEPDGERIWVYVDTVSKADESVQLLGPVRCFKHEARKAAHLQNDK